MKLFNKIAALFLIFIMLLGCVGNAYANGIEPRDGFSWAHSTSDPSGGGGYGSYGAWTNGSTALDVALSNLTVGALALALGRIIPGIPTEELRNLASLLLGAAGGYLTTPMLYYEVRIAYHNTMPGFYHKKEFRWFADSDHDNQLLSYPTIVYAFRA